MGICLPCHSPPSPTHGIVCVCMCMCARFVCGAQRGDLMAAYYKRLTGDDPEVRQAAAKAWSIWEGRTSKLIPDPDYVKRWPHTVQCIWVSALSGLSQPLFIMAGTTATSLLWPLHASSATTLSTVSRWHTYRPTADTHGFCPVAPCAVLC